MSSVFTVLEVAARYKAIEVDEQIALNTSNILELFATTERLDAVDKQYLDMLNTVFKDIEQLTVFTGRLDISLTELLQRYAAFVDAVALEQKAQDSALVAVDDRLTSVRQELVTDLNALNAQLSSFTTEVLTRFELVQAEAALLKVSVHALDTATNLRVTAALDSLRALSSVVDNQGLAIASLRSDLSDTHNLLLSVESSLSARVNGLVQRDTELAELISTTAVSLTSVIDTLRSEVASSVSNLVDADLALEATINTTAETLQNAVNTVKTDLAANVQLQAGKNSELAGFIQATADTLNLQLQALRSDYTKVTSELIAKDTWLEGLILSATDNATVGLQEVKRSLIESVSSLQRRDIELAELIQSNTEGLADSLESLRSDVTSSIAVLAQKDADNTALMQDMFDTLNNGIESAQSELSSVKTEFMRKDSELNTSIQAVSDSMLEQVVILQDKVDNGISAVTARVQSVYTECLTGINNAIQNDKESTLLLQKALDTAVATQQSNFTTCKSDLDTAIETITQEIDVVRDLIGSSRNMVIPVEIISPISYDGAFFCNYVAYPLSFAPYFNCVIGDIPYGQIKVVINRGRFEFPTKFDLRWTKVQVVLRYSYELVD